MKLLKLLTLMVMITGAQSAFAGDIKVSEPWVRAAKQGHNSAVYLKIQNAGSKDVRLIKAECAASKDVQIHESYEKDGHTGMRELKDGILCPPGQNAELKQGGLHIMLMRLTQDLEESKDKNQPRVLPVTLTFDNGQSIEIMAKIQKTSSPGCHHKRHHS